MRVWRGSGKRHDNYQHQWETTWPKPKDDKPAYAGVDKDGKLFLITRSANTEEEKFAVPFQEPFMTYVPDREFWFVTESGKLYRSGPVGKRKVEAVWDDEASPIRALLTDADTDRTFAFTEPADGKKGRRVYFEVGVKPVPKPFERRDLSNFKAPKPLDAVLSYADVLVTHKAIRLPAAKPMKPEPKK
jgi:hypothetical protein